MKLILLRKTQNDNQTLGTLSVVDDKGVLVFSCTTLELPWKNNQHNVSCIPVGVYTVQMIYSEKYKYHFTVNTVSDRQGILIHIGNYTADTHGCILVGHFAKPADKGAGYMVCESAVTIGRLIQLIRKTTKMEIINSLENIEVLGITHLN